jgi:hypothetical protein
LNALGGGTRLFLNDGLADFPKPPMSRVAPRTGDLLALADVDGDDDLDLYAAIFGRTPFSTTTTKFVLRDRNGRPSGDANGGRPWSLTDQPLRVGSTRTGTSLAKLTLWLNDGAGRFSAAG